MIDANRRACLVAIDPSITAPGYAVIDLSHSDPRPIAAGGWNTAPAKGARTSNDNMRRGLYIWRELRALLLTHRPLVIAIESGSGSKNAKTATMLGIAQTVAACAADEYLDRASPVYVSAIEASTVIGIERSQRRQKGAPAKTSTESARDRKARKRAIAEAVIARFGTQCWIEALGVSPTADLLAERWEGAHDAAAVALAAWERPEVAGLRQIARQSTLFDRIPEAQSCA